MVKKKIMTNYISKSDTIKLKRTITITVNEDMKNFTDFEGLTYFEDSITCLYGLIRDLTKKNDFEIKVIDTALEDNTRYRYHKFRSNSKLSKYVNSYHPFSIELEYLLRELNFLYEEYYEIEFLDDRLFSLFENISSLLEVYFFQDRKCQLLLTEAKIFEYLDNI